ncbi:Holliday junction branch migration protein RuvA [Candidatus Falkowbacteria bacterium CG_4_10_14_0_2_um_filter_41_15]|uniref:Holliday junction branch migration complex subunit RuvA n=3 Tax=Candidatus Falkowiibacteriota TaxID=1752728 RepID=A0A1J4TBS9_9BACT|nr:MAG: Holliday junction DNA helicase RuvA [Candidatus Falkowbacteria bacterium CG1_02_41_21]PIZ11184.1 MAG: Holliday junction branch migration protein RuvA [Candidatus Falkowbacteria bacterium CG_4_10_14_0_8_um_filter_41_36]PJA09338.1 MAG: Holliday junction branch migration protein RuvA [Candidatus Falkowbacteria bacterium CG_4_10_14_0_2_um_filter_41_15]
MISYLKGNIIYKNNNYLILDVVGVGYSIYLSEKLLQEVKINSAATFYIHQHVREDALDLYGFKNVEDLELFGMLLSVSGIGPKSALGVLSVASSQEVIQSIARGDSVLLTKVSGIGQKTAERLVLELKSKIIKLGGQSLDDFGSAITGSDEIDALMSLGYSFLEAREALRAVSPSIVESGARVKEALKNMRK